MVEEREQPYGTYSEQIPMDKLKKLINEKLAGHTDPTDEKVREYAEQVVKAEISPTVESSENVVDALVQEILRDAK